MKVFIKIMFAVWCGVLTPGYLIAQQATTGLSSKLNSLSFEVYLLLVVILLLLIIVLFLAGMLIQLAGHKYTSVSPQAATVKVPTFFQRINKTVALEDEEKLDMKHDYDGISELDNNTPSWWSYAFYFTILFGVVYMYRVFVSKSMPTQLDELKYEYELAEVRNAQFLQSTANKIDESNVTLLDAAAIGKGAMTFKVNCAVCHGVLGEGNAVGPNLTDNYWIHKGGIKDIFTTIKYGFPEKGMKAWKDDFTPLQIAELASYVKSLQGSNPPGAKEKQGDLYVDNTNSVIDTVVLATGDTTSQK